ncbi:MAG: hypothetical protein BMS9Abin04_390 [Planctomycetia bacterium]|nr:MAG: hypothetical protein BMS9Abin04_390 [Planctomycetia bacterium]
MPKVSVKVPHGGDPKDIVKKIQTALEKTVGSFEGHDLSIDWQDTTGQFHFKSLGFTIAGTAQVDQDQVAVDIQLPLAAMMFKDRVEKAVSKNLTRAIEGS